jgi:hypothetical protein
MAPENLGGDDRDPSRLDPLSHFFELVPCGLLHVLPHGGRDRDAVGCGDEGEPHGVDEVDRCAVVTRERDRPRGRRLGQGGEIDRDDDVANAIHAALPRVPAGKVTGGDTLSVTGGDTLSGRNRGRPDSGIG